MKVLLADGPKAGTVIDVEVAEPSFTLEGVRYTIVYDVRHRHPTKANFKMAAPFAVTPDSLAEALSGDLEFDLLMTEVLRGMMQYRWLPDIRIYERDSTGKGPGCF